MVKNIRRNEYEGLVLPAGYEAELLSTGGTRQFDTNAIINRYDARSQMIKKSAESQKYVEVTGENI